MVHSYRAAMNLRGKLHKSYKNAILAAILPFLIFVGIEWLYGGYFFAYSAPILFASLTLTSLFRENHQNKLWRNVLWNFGIFVPSLVFYFFLESFSFWFIMTLLLLLTCHTILGILFAHFMMRIGIAIGSILLSGIFSWKISVINAFVPLNSGIQAALASTNGLGELRLFSALLRLGLLTLFLLLILALRQDKH